MFEIDEKIRENQEQKNKLNIVNKYLRLRQRYLFINLFIFLIHFLITQLDFYIKSDSYSKTLINT